MNVPPSRARRQLAARLALHSQQKADAEAGDVSDSPGIFSPSAENAATTSGGHDDLDDDGSNDIEHDPLADPVIDDDDDVDVEGISFGEPLHISPPTQPRDTEAASFREAQLRGGEGEGGEDGVVESSFSTPPRATKPKPSAAKSPPSPAGRHLDLDDFANSPAADPDDTDVEMKVALG